MLLGDSGRRTFTYCLKEKLRQLQFGKVAMDTGDFFCFVVGVFFVSSLRVCFRPVFASIVIGELFSHWNAA
jgi:hypothetical protein